MSKQSEEISLPHKSCNCAECEAALKQAHGNRRIFLDRIAYVVARYEEDEGRKMWIAEVPLRPPIVDRDHYSFDSAILRRDSLEDLKAAVELYCGKAT